MDKPSTIDRAAVTLTIKGRLAVQLAQLEALWASFSDEDRERVVDFLSNVNGAYRSAGRTLAHLATAS
jgi:hypothetical protein